MVVEEFVNREGVFFICLTVGELNRIVLEFIYLFEMWEGRG